MIFFNSDELIKSNSIMNKKKKINVKYIWIFTQIRGDEIFLQNCDINVFFALIITFEGFLYHFNNG